MPAALPLASRDYQKALSNTELIKGLEDLHGLGENLVPLYLIRHAGGVFCTPSWRYTSGAGCLLLAKQRTISKKNHSNLKTSPRWNRLTIRLKT